MKTTESLLLWMLLWAVLLAGCADIVDHGNAGNAGNAGNVSDVGNTGDAGDSGGSEPVVYPDGLSLSGLPAATGDSVTARLQLSGSEGLSLAYAWSVDGGWSISSGQGTESVRLTAPANPSSATLQVTVSDSSGRQARASVPLTMQGDGTPVLDNLLLSLQPGQDVLELEAEARDPNGLALSYGWSSAGVPVSSAASTSWQPPISGRYSMQVSVNNGSHSAVGMVEMDYLGSAPWAFFRGSRQGLGSSVPQDTSANTGGLKWKTAFTPAITNPSYNFISGVAQGRDGTLYVGSVSDGKLYACDPDSGAVKWSFATAGSSIQSSPAVAADGTIYIALHDSDIIYAVNPDGSEKWQYAAGGGITFSSPAAIGADGTIYIGTDDGTSDQLIALNPDGTLKWSYGLGDITGSSVNFAADGTVYARDYAGNFHAINPADGTNKWPPLLVDGGSASSPVVAADGTIYFASFALAATKFYAVNPDGDAGTAPTVKWASDLGSLADSHYSLYGIGATAAIGTDGTVYIATWENYDGYVGGDKGAVYAIDPADGSVKWRHEIYYSVQTSLAVGGDGRVYVISKEGVVYALDPASGAEKWTYAMRPTALQINSGSPSIGADGSLYFYHVYSGELVAIH